MMDPRSQKTFDKMMTKGSTELLEHEVGFLRARASYLTTEQAEKFADALDPDYEVVPEDKVADEDNKTNSVLHSLSYRDLQKEAKKFGIKAVGVKHDELLVLVQEAYTE